MFLAREAPIGVILRRGPSAWTRLSLWHTDTDTFGHGQWFRGRVYERRCDVARDGSLFVYFARKTPGGAPGQSQRADSWVAVSRPPWLAALALWWVGGTYCAGGFFPDHVDHDGQTNPGGLASPGGRADPPGRSATQALFVAGLTQPPDEGSLPPWLTLTAEVPYVDRTNNWTERTVWCNRLLRDGWVRLPDASPAGCETWERRHPSLPFTLVMTQMHTGFAFHTYGGPYLVEYAIRAEPQGAPPESPGSFVPLGQATWADWDQQGRLVLAQQGRLLAWQPPSPVGELRQIADFDDQLPEPAPAPAWAHSWSGWA